MNVFQSVKEAVSTRTAAEMYGIKVGRNGMTRCPFHDDHTPSMKLDKRYHCFGCGADGDVIDFTAQLFTIGKMEAAKKLAQDSAKEFMDELEHLPELSKEELADLSERVKKFRKH